MKVLCQFFKQLFLGLFFQRRKEREEARKETPGQHSHWGPQIGDLKIFKEKLSEGFTEVAFHANWGPWMGDCRLMGIWAFFHPDGCITCWEFWKFDDGSRTAHATPREKLYSPTDLAELLAKYHVKLGEKKNLASWVDDFRREIREYLKAKANKVGPQGFWDWLERAERMT